MNQSMKLKQRANPYPTPSKKSPKAKRLIRKPKRFLENDVYENATSNLTNFAASPPTVTVDDYVQDVRGSVSPFNLSSGEDSPTHR